MNVEARLPEGFELIRSGRVTAAVRSSGKAMLLALGVLNEAQFEQVRAAGAPLGGGRGGVVAVPLDPGTPERVVIRHFRRGGMLGRMLGDRYLSRARFLAEVAVSEAARQAGVPTPECLAAVTRQSGMFCSADLIVREVPDAVSLEHWLRQNADASDVAVDEVLAAVAETFGKLVAANIYHPDLHAGNVLVQNTDAGTRAHVIDLDRAVQVTSLDAKTRNAMLFRFNRALVKRCLAPPPVTLGRRMRFCRLVGVADSRVEMRRFVTECGSHLRRHSWKY